MNTIRSGFILIDKPSGPTSHDIINILRRITGIKKIGHAGTLDPFASGLLIVAIGREATREISKYVKLDKEYLATLHLGAVTDTHDREGVRTKVESSGLVVELKDIENTVRSFRGKQKQVPPMYSAKKIKGKKLYELARKGIEVKREPVDIDIIKLEIVSYVFPELIIRVACSSGTYIRSLAHDIGQALGTGAYLEELKRTSIGEFSLDKSIKLEELNEDSWKDNLFNKIYDRKN